MDKVKEYLLDNVEILKDITREINGYDGSLDWLDYFENDEYFFKDMFYNRPEEAVRAVCYGDYNYTDDYVKFNAYGNLDSCNEWEYEDELKDNIDEIMDRLVELKDKLCLDEYIEDKELLELLEESDM